MIKEYDNGIVIEIKDATDILPTLKGIGAFLKTVIDEDNLTDRQKRVLDDICTYGIALSRWDDGEIKLKEVYCYGSNGNGEPKLCDRKGCKCGIIECTTIDDILNDQYPIYIKGMNNDICVRDDSL